jgi:uncharacterized RDD family membrane protein YckC
MSFDPTPSTNTDRATPPHAGDRYVSHRWVYSTADAVFVLMIMPAGATLMARELVPMFTSEGQGDRYARLAVIMPLIAFFVFEAFTGVSPAKWCGGLKVVTPNGAPAGVVRLHFRTLLRWWPVLGLLLVPALLEKHMEQAFTAITIWWLACWIASFLADLTRHRTWYDWLSGTALVDG